MHRKSPYKWGIQGNILRIKRSDLINILTIERIVQHYKQHCGKLLFKSFFQWPAFRISSTFPKVRTTLFRTISSTYHSEVLHYAVTFI